MKRQDYQVDKNVSKTTEDITLWKNEKAIVEIAKDTIAVKIILDDQQSGYVFHGEGKLLIDTIVETDKGAIGNPVERVVDDPFLMLGKLEAARQHLDAADSKDFSRLGYEDQQQFISKAESLLDLFFEGTKCRQEHSRTFGKNGSFVFAFPNDNEKLDILVAKDSKLVYTATERVFVSKGDKVILTSHGEVVVSQPGKSVFITKNCSPSVHICKGKHKWSLE